MCALPPPIGSPERRSARLAELPAGCLGDGLADPIRVRLRLLGQKRLDALRGARQLLALGRGKYAREMARVAGEHAHDLAAPGRVEARAARQCKEAARLSPGGAAN